MHTAFLRVTSASEGDPCSTLALGLITREHLLLWSGERYEKAVLDSPVPGVLNAIMRHMALSFGSLNRLSLSSYADTLYAESALLGAAGQKPCFLVVKDPVSLHIFGKIAMDVRVSTVEGHPLHQLLDLKVWESIGACSATFPFLVLQQCSAFLLLYTSSQELERAACLKLPLSTSQEGMLWALTHRAKDPKEKQDAL